MKEFVYKYKIIIIITLIGIALLIITRSCSRAIQNSIRQDLKKDEKSTNEYLIKYKDNWEMKINHFLGGEITYDEMPISNIFKKKYPQLHSIIKGKCTRESCNSYFDMNNASENNVMTISYKTDNGYEMIGYKLHYVINEKNELDDIEILDSKVIEDENGEFIQYDKYYYYLDCDFSYGLLVRPAVNKPNYLYVSDNFIKKFPEYPNKGVLKDYSYMIVEDLYYDKENPLICWALVMDLEKTTLFKIQVKLDDKGYVDDVDVNIDNVKKTEDTKYVQSVYDEYYS